MTDYISPRFRIRADLDRKLSYLALDHHTTKQALAEEAILALIQKYEEEKTMTVTMYRIHVTKATTMQSDPDNYSLAPWPGDDVYTEGSDDGGHEYELPTGYRLGQTKHGEPCIYDSRDDSVLIDKYGATPCIWNHGQRILLKRSAE